MEARICDLPFIIRQYQIHRLNGRIRDIAVIDDRDDQRARVLCDHAGAPRLPSPSAPLPLSSDRPSQLAN